MATCLEGPLWLLLAAENPGAGGFFGLTNAMFPLIIIFVLFYFMLIRPERRRKAEMARMLENLKNKDRVVTAGGIKGVIVNVQQNSDEVTLRVDENTNTKLRVLRSSIARVIRDDDAEGGGESGK
jgi:preprotein translocase subunit YajC